MKYCAPSCHLLHRCNHICGGHVVAKSAEASCPNAAEDSTSVSPFLPLEWSCLPNIRWCQSDALQSWSWRPLAESLAAVSARLPLLHRAVCSKCFSHQTHEDAGKCHLSECSWAWIYIYIYSKKNVIHIYINFYMLIVVNIFINVHIFCRRRYQSALTTLAVIGIFGGT